MKNVKTYENIRTNRIMPRKIKIKNDFGQIWRWDRTLFWKTTCFRVWARFCLIFFLEKKLLLRVWTRVFEKVFEKRHFLRIWQRVVVNLFERQKTFLRIGQRFFFKSSPRAPQGIHVSPSYYLPHPLITPPRQLIMPPRQPIMPPRRLIMHKRTAYYAY